MTPKISVCIPAYNAQKYIVETIESVLEQTDCDFELIICDDCSYDNTEKIVKTFSDARIRYVKNKQKLGAIRNFNECIAQAAAPYVCIFHADDIMLSENLEKKLNILKIYPRVGFVFSSIYRINETGEMIGGAWTKDHTADFIRTSSDYFLRLFLGDNPVVPSTMLIRRECFEKVGVFDTRLAHTADHEMCMRIALFYDVAYLHEPLVKYRWHDASDTHSYSDAEKIEQRYKSRYIIIKKFPRHISNAKRLKCMSAVDHGKLAVRRAYYHFCMRRYADSLRYSLFILKLFFLYTDNVVESLTELYLIAQQLIRTVVRKHKRFVSLKRYFGLKL